MILDPACVPRECRSSRICAANGIGRAECEGHQVLLLDENPVTLPEGAVEIDLRARHVDEIDTEQAVTLLLCGGVAIRIERIFELAEPAAMPIFIDPEKLSADLELGLMFRGRVVGSAIADEETGLLSITFFGGLVLRVPLDSDFEAWSTSWSDGSTVVALPGGGLSSWGARL